MAWLLLHLFCVLNTLSVAVWGSDGHRSLSGYPWITGVSKANNQRRYHRADPLLRKEALLSDDDGDDLLDSDALGSTEELIFGIGEGRKDASRSSKEQARRNMFEVQPQLSDNYATSFEESSSSVPQSSWFRQPIHPGSNLDAALPEKYKTFKSGAPIDKARLRSTGTTIVGCLVNGCVVLGADTRATDDRMVADKRCEKVHCISSNVWCCGAGTSADLDALVRKVRYSLALQNMHSESIGNRDTSTESADLFDSQQQPASGIFTSKSSVSLVCRLLRDTLYSAGGSVGANLVLGGYDHDTARPVLVAIHPHGSMDVVPYSALGSGGLAAMGVLESRYHENLSLDEGIALVQDAVKAGIDNDLGSGSQIDLVIIGPHGANYTKGVVPEEVLESYRTTSQPSVLDTTLEQYSKGVNGFGNLPYTVQSTRVMLRSQEYEDEKEQLTWKDILGL